MAIYKSFRLFLIPTANLQTPLTDAVVYESDIQKWTKVGDIPTARGSHSNYMYGGKLLIVGGFTTSGLSNALEMISPS